MFGIKPLQAGSSAKPGPGSALRDGRLGSHAAGGRARRVIGAITELFNPGQPQPTGVYLPLVRLDRDH